jgi:hypothetical protein
MAPPVDPARKPPGNPSERRIFFLPLKNNKPIKLSSLSKATAQFRFALSSGSYETNRPSFPAFWERPSPRDSVARRRPRSSPLSWNSLDNSSPSSSPYHFLPPHNGTSPHPPRRLSPAQSYPHGHTRPIRSFFAAVSSACPLRPLGDIQPRCAPSGRRPSAGGGPPGKTSPQTSVSPDVEKTCIVRSPRAENSLAQAAES